jgi:hypothetical protein
MSHEFVHLPTRVRYCPKALSPPLGAELPLAGRFSSVIPVRAAPAHRLRPDPVHPNPHGLIPDRPAGLMPVALFQRTPAGESCLRRPGPALRIEDSLPRRSKFGNTAARQTLAVFA